LANTKDHVKQAPPAAAFQLSSQYAIRPSKAKQTTLPYVPPSFCRICHRTSKNLQPSSSIYTCPSHLPSNRRNRASSPAGLPPIIEIAFPNTRIRVTRLFTASANTLQDQPNHIPRISILQQSDTPKPLLDLLLRSRISTLLCTVVWELSPIPYDMDPDVIRCAFRIAYLIQTKHQYSRNLDPFTKRTVVLLTESAPYLKPLSNLPAPTKEAFQKDLEYLADEVIKQVSRTIPPNLQEISETVQQSVTSAIDKCFTSKATPPPAPQPAPQLALVQDQLHELHTLFSQLQSQQTTYSQPRPPEQPLQPLQPLPRHIHPPGFTLGASQPTDQPPAIPPAPPWPVRPPDQLQNRPPQSWW
jgi:hypothetical protein